MEAKVAWKIEIIQYYSKLKYCFLRPDFAPYAKPLWKDRVV